MGYESIAVDEYANLEEALSAELLSGKLLKMIERADAYYCAVEESSGYVGGVVVLELQHGTERLFKHIPEKWGPAACMCPIEILRLLTPTNDIDVNAWRERCWTWNSEVVKAAMDDPKARWLEVAERLNMEAYPQTLLPSRPAPQ